MSNPTELPDLYTVISFLLGEGALDGSYFGDSDTKKPRKRYWWREHLRAARRAQPEGEAPQAEPLSEARIDRIARAYFSEQWAVQHAKDAIHDALTEAVAAVQVEVPEGFVLVPIKPTPKMVDATFNHVHLGSESHNARNKRVYAAMIAAAPAATLSPLCGAQHAESGKEAQCTIGVGDGSGRLFVHGDYDSIMAVRSIIIENEYLRAAQQAAAPAPRLSETKVWEAVKRHAQSWTIFNYAEFDREGLDAFAIELMDSQRAASSAPGTPEAPSHLMQALTNGIPLKEPVSLGKALWAQREARAVLSGGTGPVAAVHLVNIGLTGWVHTKETAEAWADGYNTALKQYRSVLRVLAIPSAPPSSTAARKEANQMADTYHVKDHVVREVVNRLRATALEFHAHGSLRERLARELEPLLAASTVPEMGERAAFEKAMNDSRFFPRELDFSRTKSPSGRDEYANSHLQSNWEGWQARAALASRPAEVDDEALPALPKPTCLVPGVYAYTSQQYRQGQRDAVAAYKMAESFCEANCCWSGHHAECFRSKEVVAPSHTTHKEK